MVHAVNFLLWLLLFFINEFLGRSRLVLLSELKNLSEDDSSYDHLDVKYNKVSFFTDLFSILADLLQTFMDCFLLYLTLRFSTRLEKHDQLINDPMLGR